VIQDDQQPSRQYAQRQQFRPEQPLRLQWNRQDDPDQQQHGENHQRLGGPVAQVR